MRSRYRSVPQAHGSAFAAVPSVTLGATLTTPVSAPLSTTIGGVTLALAGGSVSCSWTPGTGLSCSASVDGASVETSGTTTQLALPTADPRGNLQLPPGVSETVAEAVLSAFLASSRSTLAQSLHGLLGLGGPLSAAAAGPAGAALPTLAQDPVGWAVGRLAAQFAADGTAALQSLTASIYALVTGAAPSAQPFAGTGTADDPYLIPLGTGGPGSIAIAVWADPDGPPIPSSTSSALLQPPALAEWLSGSGSALSTAQIAQLLESASACVPELAQLLAGRATAAAGWDALIARGAGGDGLLPGQAPDITGSTSVPQAGIPHTELPAHLTLASLGLPAAGVTFYITGPYEPPWPDPALPTIDLTTPGLAATAFDVSAVAGAGPGMSGCRSAVTARGPTRPPGARPRPTGSPRRSPRPATPGSRCCSSPMARLGARPSSSPPPERRWSAWCCSECRPSSCRWTFWTRRQRPTRWPCCEPCCQPRPAQPTARTSPWHVRCSTC